MSESKGPLMPTPDIDIGTACERILGVSTARSITADMGLHWAIVAATAAALTTDDPEAIRVLREHLANQRELDAMTKDAQRI